MKASFWRRGRTVVALGAAIALVVGFRGQTAVALTPESPAVKRAIKKAVKFLESDKGKDDRMGAKALVGLVMLKNHADAKDPRIVDAVSAIQDAVKAHEPAAMKLDSPIYSAGLAVIFLATLDPHAYAGEIDSLLRFLQYQQKPHGGWGYPDRESGDTSMTQYGVLSAWEAKQAGCRISRESVEKVTTWLLKTQDPSGAYGYQGAVSPIDALIKQSDIRYSMVVGGVGSVYMCANLLELVPRAARRDENLPPALKEVEVEPPPAAAAPNLKGNIDPRRIKAAESRGNSYILRKCKLNFPDWWTFYYLYAYERYASFRDLAEGRSDKEPAWYTEGARFLLKIQENNGSWTTKESILGKTPDTAFAALFLLRSSKRSIEKAYGYGESTLVTGRGLPKETARVAVAEGKVLPVPRWTSAAELLPILENRQDAAFDEAIAALEQLPPKEAELLAAKHAEVLRRLVADRSLPARIAAVKAIGNGGNLDLVPALIFALDDPDPGAAGQAGEALRRLTRSLGQGAITGPLTEDRRREEIQYWKHWYLTLRPEAEFDN